MRNLDEATLYAFRHPKAEVLEPLRSRIPVEALRRTNRHRIFDLAEGAGQEAASNHFTEIRTCPLPVVFNAYRVDGTSNETLKGTFDFESARKELNTLEILAEGTFLELAPKTRVLGEYIFLGVRYVFQTEVREIDKDFGLVVLEVPNVFLAITSRRFDRFKTDKAATLSLTESEPIIEATMIDISPSGANIQLNEDAAGLSLGKAVSFRVTGVEGEIASEVAFVSKQRVGLSFRVESDADRKFLRILLNSSIPETLLLRDPKNCQLFFPLYRETGYAPKDDKFEEWAKGTSEMWAIQDRLLPGNYVGGKSSDSLAVCTGTMPLSSNVVFGHSWGMLKSLDAISLVSDILAQQNSWIDLLPGISHLSWCVRKESRFMGRLHFAFDHHAHPDEQTVYPSLAILPCTTSYMASSKLTVEKASTDNLESLPKQHRELLRRIGTPHPALEGLHTLEHCLLKDQTTGDVIAYLVCSDTPDRFTAIDLFKNVWCLLLKDYQDLPEICKAIRASEGLGKHEIDVFASPEHELPVCSGVPDVTTLPIIWYFLTKDDFAPILASMFRTIYSVLRKYGEEAIPHLSRVMGA